MSKVDVFEYNDYKSYLLAIEKKWGRGFRAEVARTLRCQSAYVSQILKGSGHLTAEHADLVNQFLRHGEEEANYFLLIVQVERAGTKSLRQYFEKQIAKSRENNLRLKVRLGLPTIRQEDQSLYYSSWKYPAIHVAVSMRSHKSAASIGSALNIDTCEVQSILDDLARIGLLQHIDDWYAVAKFRVHLSDDSPYIVQHHSNWRYKALESLNHATPHDFDRRLHYSSVVTLARRDVRKVRASLFEHIQLTKDIIRKSEEEQVYGFSLDFFPVGIDFGAVS